MLRQILILGLILSVVLVSGCVQDNHGTAPGTTGQLTDKQIEDQAVPQMEQEINQATDNIDLSDLENSIPE